jgi:hypothetical protein
MSFDISRLRRADQIVGGGAIALFIFLFFFKWYGFSTNAPSIGGVNVSGSISYSGWHTFTNSRWVWIITIIVALGAVAIRAGLLKLELPLQPGVLVAGLGALSTLLILYRILDHPSASASFGGVHTSVGIKIGIWLGLIAAAAITYGGYLAMQDEGTSLADVRDQASQAVSSATTSVSSPSEGSASAAPSPSGTSTAPPVSGTGAGAGPGADVPAAPPIPPPVVPPTSSPAAPPIPPAPAPPSEGSGGEGS